MQNRDHLYHCQTKFGIAKKCMFCFANKICWLPIKARQSWAIPPYTAQSNMAWFSFSRDSLVTKYSGLAIQDLSTPTCLSACHTFVSCQNVMQEIQCDAHMSQFSHMLPSKFATLTPPKFARTILTQHSHLKQITSQRSMKMHIDPPRYVCHTSLHLIGYICLTFLHCVFSSLSSMHSDPLRFVCQASLHFLSEAPTSPKCVSVQQHLWEKSPKFIWKYGIVIDSAEMFYVHVFFLWNEGNNLSWQTPLKRQTLNKPNHHFSNLPHDFCSASF